MLMYDFLFYDNSNNCPIFTVYEIFTIEMCMTLTLNFRMDQGQI